MRGHRSRGNLRGGGRAGFQWRRNDRANPGPSRPANPGPNNPNYHEWNNHHGARWNESYSEQDSTESEMYRRAYGFDARSMPSRDIDDRSFQQRRSEPPDWHPPRYDHHTIREVEKRNQQMMQQSPILESRRPPSPRVFYPGSPKQTNQSESPSFISDQSPRANFNQPAEENRNWNAEKKVRKDLFNSTNEEPERPKPPVPTQNNDAHAPTESTDNLVRTFDYSNSVPVQEPVQFAIQPPKKFIDYSRTNPLSDENRPENESRDSKKHRKRSPRRDKRSRSRDKKDRKKKSRDKRSREKSRTPSPKSKKSSRDRPKKSDRKAKISEEDQELYEPESDNEDVLYIPTSNQEFSNMDIPKEYTDISTHMTQVLETMMERQRLEMHKKLNEMFKTYFDARTEDLEIEPEEDEENQIDQNEVEDEEEDDEEDAELIERAFENYQQRMTKKLRQAAMQSANIDSSQSGTESDSKSKREVLDSKKSESPRFENFQQFKEYKQKMRDQGLENESIIVSIPNTTAESSTILDNEMSEMDTRTNETEKSPHSIDKNVSSNTPILQVKLSSDQRQVSEPNSASAEIITAENIQSESPKDDRPSSKSTEKAGLKWTDLVYRDPGKHWCQVTTRWLSTFSTLLSHLHSEEYHSKLPLKEKPWKKRLDLFTLTVKERDAIKESLNEPIELSKGSEFIVPIQAFKCKLCENIFRTEADVSAHFLSTSHNSKYEEFTTSNKNYEFVRLEQMQKSVQEKKREIENQRKLCNLQLRQKLSSKKRHKSPVSSSADQSNPTKRKSLGTETKPVSFATLAASQKKVDQTSPKPASSQSQAVNPVTKSPATIISKKPRSAAIERILAMSKKKKKSKNSGGNNNHVINDSNTSTPRDTPTPESDFGAPDSKEDFEETKNVRKSSDSGQSEASTENQPEISVDNACISVDSHKDSLPDDDVTMSNDSSAKENLETKSDRQNESVNEQGVVKSAEIDSNESPGVTPDGPVVITLDDRVTPEIIDKDLDVVPMESLPVTANDPAEEAS